MVCFELDNVLWQVWSVEGAWTVNSSVVKRLQNYFQVKELFFSTELTQRLITVMNMRWKPLMFSVMGQLGYFSAERTQDLNSLVTMSLQAWAFLTLSRMEQLWIFLLGFVGPARRCHYKYLWLFKIHLWWFKNTAKMCHRITEWFVLEGTLKTMFFWHPCHGQGCHPKSHIAQGPMNT